MKLEGLRRKINFTAIFATIIFFLVSVFVFFLYSVNFSSLILVGIFALYLKYYYKQKDLPSFFDLLLLVTLAVLIVILTTAIFRLPYLSIPAIGFIVLITLLFDNLQLSILFSVFLSTLIADVLKGDVGLAVGSTILCSTLIATLLSYRVRTRFGIIKAIFYAASAQFVIAYIVEYGHSLSFSFLADSQRLAEAWVYNILFSLMVIPFLPVFEYIFRVLTNISLLELSDFNHPLLKRMILEAPGTYQHSLVVANLAEAAAESIGANSLLARVGAYYHDIGKIAKAHYFVENQIPYRDVHKGLKPSISKLIIMKHVKDGVELARKAHLNPKIIEFIVQHHGRSLVYYFYQRALDESNQEREEEYRYPGPRPQSKEIAIVSLSDTIEALSRTLEEPTPARIEEMVRGVVRKKFVEGELDESELTLKDLEKIIGSFTRILNAVFHTRINYPQNGTDKKSSNAQENKPK